VRSNQHRDRASWLRTNGGANVDARLANLFDQTSAGGIFAYPRYQPRWGAKRGNPGAEVCRLAATPGTHDRRYVVARSQHATRNDRDVQEQVADGAEDRGFDVGYAHRMIVLQRRLVGHDT